MSLGLSRPRNWGVDAQSAALFLALKKKRVNYHVTCVNGQSKRLKLWLASNHDGLQLPFTDSVAELVHVRRGRWEARHQFDNRLLAIGISRRDVIRATIEAAWN